MRKKENVISCAGKLLAVIVSEIAIFDINEYLLRDCLIRDFVFV